MIKQANSKNCFVCGVENHHGLMIKFYIQSAGKVVATATVPNHFQGYPGIVHGGVITAMLDEVSGRAVMGETRPRWMVTASINVRFRRPVPVEAPLKLVGTLKEDSGRMAKVHGEILDENDVLLAESEALMAAVPESVQATLDNMPGELWKVYPDEEIA